jgi:hypothetical protein
MERADAKFIEQAADDSQRQTAIERLTKTRRYAFWYATFAAVFFLFVALSDGFGGHNLSTHETVSLILLGVVSLAAGAQLMKLDSDLRLLKLVEKLKK